MKKENRIINVEKNMQLDESGRVCVSYNLEVMASGGSVIRMSRVSQKRIDGTPAVGRNLQCLSGPLWTNNGYLWRVQGNWFYNTAKKLKRRFDYTPIDVQEPKADFFVYAPGQKRFLGYNVVVTYKNNQRKTFFFSHDMDHYAFFTKDFAYERALGFYKKKCKQMQR